MKKIILVSLVCLSFVIVFYNTVFAADSNPWLSIAGGENTTHKISLGGKYHFDYSNFDKIPIEEDDYSYLLFYEMHNDFAYWQVGGAFTPGPDDDRFDHIITPQINLIAKDSIFRVGLGALASCVRIDGDDDWTRLYWQVIFGLGIPLGSRFSIDILGHYVFEGWNWDKITEPTTESPEISVTLSFSF